MPQITPLIRSVYICVYRWQPSQTSLALSLHNRKLQPNPPKHRSSDIVQRRHQIGGHLATACGRWSHAWARAVISWDDHVRRAHDDCAWSHVLLDWQPEEWLMWERLLHSAFGESRTRSRAYRGRVQQRWSAGVQLAEAVVST